MKARSFFFFRHRPDAGFHRAVKEFGIKITRGGRGRHHRAQTLRVLCCGEFGAPRVKGGRACADLRARALLFGNGERMPRGLQRLGLFAGIETDGSEIERQRSRLAAIAIPRDRSFIGQRRSGFRGGDIAFGQCGAVGAIMHHHRIDGLWRRFSRRSRTRDGRGLRAGCIPQGPLGSA